jgi:twinkle protein
MSDSRIIERHIPCPCGRSSDAYCRYDDGHGFCFSCNQVHQEEPTKTLTDIHTFEFLPWRGVTKETMAFYGAITKIDANGQPTVIGFPYGPDTFKIRHLDKKEFYSTGNMSEASLFGQDKFQAGQSRALTITEGEMDAMSVYQMLGSKYPVVSVRGASSAKKDCAKNRDWLNQFERIYLCFDNDQAGEKAAREVRELFDFNKVYIVKLTKFKDANDYLTQGDPSEFVRVWHNSKRYMPEGIISSFSEFDAVIDEKVEKQGVAFPFPTLQAMTYGFFQGKCALFTALEGVGKTEILRAIEFNLLNTTDHNVGIIHLEEDKSRLLKGLAGYELRTPCHLPDTPISDAEIKAAYRSVIKREDRAHIYTDFGTDDPDEILDRVRFLAAACDCKYIFLDHITRIVTGMYDADQVKILDYLSTKLDSLVQTLNFGLIFVSHVNDDGKTRGSRNISKIAHLWVHLDRDITADTETARNLTKLTIRKNRFAHKTGPAGTLIFDPSTYIVSELTGELPS